MKKYLCIVCSLVLAVSLLMVPAAPAAAQATGGPVTFEFHASNLIDVYPGEFGSPSTDAEHSYQPNARQLRDRTGDTWQYNTFIDQNSYDAYLSWRAGLIGANDGICAFNMWLLDEPRAKAWGETTVSRPGTPITATCPAGWEYTIIENPYGLVGHVIEWSTSDPTKYLRLDNDPGVFSFTADAYTDIGNPKWDVNDPPVEVGDICRIWFGSAVYEDEEGAYLDPPFQSGFVFDNLDWGDLSTYPANSPGVFPSSLYKAGGLNVGDLLQFDATLDLVAKAGTTVDLSATYTLPPPEQIGIRVDQASIGFGSVKPGVASLPRTVTVTNTGNVDEDFSASITNESPTGVYTQGLKMDEAFVADWEGLDVAAGGTKVPSLVLTVPTGTAAGTYRATLIFWAEAS